MKNVSIMSTLSVFIDEIYEEIDIIGWRVLKRCISLQCKSKQTNN